jgi:hypothetical protein
MNYTERELRRQLTYTTTMKVKMTEKYEAKMKAYDEKIEEVKLALEALNED